MQDDDLLSFNFWPAFADMMLALVLVLCLALFLVTATIAVGTVNLKEVEVNQMSMIDSIALDYKVKPNKLGEKIYGIHFKGHKDPDIEFYNDLNSQRITFSDKVLFEPDHTDIKREGEQVLKAVGTKLRQQLSLIREIQIQGHADTVASKRYNSNVELAANRAIAVFGFLQDTVGIQPSENLMSITSFGEYKSVQRSKNDQDYNLAKLQTDNISDEQRRRNRRIELVLLYRR
ncbi:MAG TPA: OmpA family protein [Pyrinomonadaceae bacterium]|nr:OmpA family protein [Pyrinomonadaceae bacterium]